MGDPVLGGDFYLGGREPLCGLPGYGRDYRRVEGGLQHGVPHAGARSGHKRGVSEQGGREIRRPALCGRPLQGREPGGVQRHELQSGYTGSYPEDLQHGRAGLPAGGAAGVRLWEDSGQGGEDSAQFLSGGDDIRVRHVFSGGEEQDLRSAPARPLYLAGDGEPSGAGRPSV